MSLTACRARTRVRGWMYSNQCSETIGQLTQIIQKCINFCARVLSGKRKHAHISGTLKSLGWLSAGQLHQFYTVWRCVDWLTYPSLRHWPRCLCVTGRCTCETPGQAASTVRRASGASLNGGDSLTESPRCTTRYHLMLAMPGRAGQRSAKRSSSTCWTLATDNRSAFAFICTDIVTRPNVWEYVCGKVLRDKCMFIPIFILLILSFVCWRKHLIAISQWICLICAINK